MKTVFRLAVFLLVLLLPFFSSFSVLAANEAKEDGADFTIEIRVENSTPEADRWIGDAVNRCLSMPDCRVEHQKDRILFYGYRSLTPGSSDPNTSVPDAAGAKGLENAGVPGSPGVDVLSPLPPAGGEPEAGKSLPVWTVEGNRIVLNVPPEGIRLEVTAGGRTTTISGGTPGPVEILLQPETRKDRSFWIWWPLFVVFFLLFFFLLGQRLIRRREGAK